LKKTIRVVLIVPKAKADYFLGAFGREGVVVCGVDAITGTREVFMRYLSLAALKTKTLWIKRKTEMRGSGAWLTYLISNRFGRKLIRLAEKISYHHSTFEMLFNEYKPDLVFSTDIQSETDIAMLIEAHKRGINTVGMVRSWDNLTSKGLIRIVPERLLVWNDIIKGEAINLHDINEMAISVVGIPHYDEYKDLHFTEKDKELFFNKINADITKKIALFIPIGDRYLRNNTVDKDIVALLDKVLPSNYQILVRLPPGDYVRALEDNTSQFARGRIIYDRPSTKFENIKHTELGKQEDMHLAQTLSWSEFVVSGPSTAVIDAALFDKPCILFGFDGYESREYLDSVRRYYDYDNFIPILKSGGAVLASSIENFISLVRKYVENPRADAKSRKTLVLGQAGFDDTNSTERLAHALINSL
jgi:CDP-glycerol glycerophosphotransferase (TagB/SpsB family)